MLKKEEFEKIGYISSTHGVHGELACKLDVELDDLIAEEPDLFFMLEDQGLLIPYRVLGHRTKGRDIDLITFSDISTKEQAEKLLGYSIWLDRTYIGEDTLSEDPLYYVRYVGYKLFLAQADEYIGNIVSVDDSTMNVLLYVDRGVEGELVVPIAEELIANYDDDRRTIHLYIAEGLLSDTAEYID